VAEIDDIVQAGGLPPCHTMFQFSVRPGKNGEKDKLDLALTQRSADMFLGCRLTLPAMRYFCRLSLKLPTSNPASLSIP